MHVRKEIWWAMQLRKTWFWRKQVKENSAIDQERPTVFVCNKYRRWTVLPVGETEWSMWSHWWNISVSQKDVDHLMMRKQLQEIYHYQAKYCMIARITQNTPFVEIILVTKLTWCRQLCHWVNIQIKLLVVLITDFHFIRLIVDCSRVDAFPDPCLEYWSFCDIQFHQSNCA